jgi:hypothetical protein
MQFNHEQFARIPDSALKEVAPDAEQADQETPGADAEDDNLRDELFSSGEHTENVTPETSTSAESNATTGPTATPRRKTLTQFTGGKGGKFAVKIMDFIMPAILAFTMRRAGYDADKELFQLDKDEKEFAEEMLNDVLDTLYIDFNNPWVQLSIGLGMIYGGKLMDISDKIKRTDKKPTVTKETPPEDVEALINDEYNETILKRIEKLKREKRRNAAWAKKHLQETGEDKMILEKIIRKYKGNPK